MFSNNNVLKTPQSEIAVNKRIPCTLHGCTRVYSDQIALESHVKDHEIPAESVPGKVLLCSSAGCSGSFPNMQKLMEHMRHHHKLNIYFQCESCRTKLRSYRGLLTHLHSCSKVPRAKLKLPEGTAAQPNSTATPDPAAMDEQPSQPETVSVPQQDSANGSFPAAAPQPEPAAPILPSALLPQETPPPLLPEEAPPAPLTNVACNQPPSLDAPKATSSPAETQSWTESMSPEPMHPPSAPQSPTAIWRKNQGLSNRRILWEHTRGRYTCVQCGCIATNRKEMTQHISSQHSGNKTVEDTGNSAANA